MRIPQPGMRLKASKVRLHRFTLFQVCRSGKLPHACFAPGTSLRNSRLVPVHIFANKRNSGDDRLQILISSTKLASIPCNIPFALFRLGLVSHCYQIGYENQSVLVRELLRRAITGRGFSAVGCTRCPPLFWLICDAFRGSLEVGLYLVRRGVAHICKATVSLRGLVFLSSSLWALTFKIQRSCKRRVGAPLFCYSEKTENYENYLLRVGRSPSLIVG
jgi:hypothetical protein